MRQQHAYRPFLRREKWGCSSDSLRYHRKHSVTGVLLHLSRGRGGYCYTCLAIGGYYYTCLAIGGGISVGSVRHKRVSSHVFLRKRRTWSTAATRGSYKSLFLLNSSLSLEK